MKKFVLIISVLTCGCNLSAQTIDHKKNNLLAGQVFINEENGHAYELVYEKLTWENAKLAAESHIPPEGFHFGHLVTFSDAAEEEFILSTFGNELDGAWIGFTDKEIEGEWRWVDDTTSIWQDPDNFPNPIQTAHTNWRAETNEPNNEFGHEHYAVYSLYQVSSPKWNDLPNHLGAYSKYVVEYKPVAGNIADNLIWQNISNELFFHPNPFSFSTNIQFTNPNKSIYKLCIFNIRGNRLYEIDNITSGRIEFERNNLPSGIYIVELIGENVFRGKMVVK